MRRAIGFLSGLLFVALVAWGMEASASAPVGYYYLNGLGGAYTPASYASERQASCTQGAEAYAAGQGEILSSAVAVQDPTWECQVEFSTRSGFDLPISYQGCPSGEWFHDSTQTCEDFEPEQPKDCSGFEGWHVRRPYTVASVGSTGDTGNWNGCEIVSTGRDLCREFNGVMECQSQWRMTGAQYGGTDAPIDEPGSGNDPTGDDAPLCLEGDGRAVCMLDHPDNCGSYNGEAYCVEEQDQPGCQSTQSGAIICLTDGSSPHPDQPTSDFGTPKQPADEWLHPDPAGDAQELWGYPYGGGGTSSGDDGTGSDGTGGDSADGSTCLGGVEECDGEGEGDGEGPVLDEVCPEGVDCDAGAGFGTLLTTIQTQGIIAEASGLSLPSGAGTCPPIAFDTELTGALATDVHCTVANDNAGLMSAAMKAVWVIVALFVLLSG